MSVTFSPDVGLNFSEENGELIRSGDEEEKTMISDEDFSEMVLKLKEIDISRLLITIQ